MVRGLTQPERRARHSSSRFSHLRVGRLRGPGEAIRVLPLGDQVHLSPSSQYPAPAGSAGDWAFSPGPRRGPGPQTGPQALAAPPAQPALTTDSAREPQRSRTEWGTPIHRQAGARRRPLTRWQCAGAGLRPASRSAPSDQAHCSFLVAPSRSRPADHPRPCESSRSQRSSTLCPPGSDPADPCRQITVVTLTANQHPVPAW